MEDITDFDHKLHAGQIKELLATYRKAEDLINIGAYVAGSNSKIDKAIEHIEKINLFLKQEINEEMGFEDSIETMKKIVDHPGE
jgi:flagellum-specific ATP synthase